MKITEFKYYKDVSELKGKTIAGVTFDDDLMAIRFDDPDENDIVSLAVFSSCALYDGESEIGEGLGTDLGICQLHSLGLVSMKEVNYVDELKRIERQKKEQKEKARRKKEKERRDLSEYARLKKKYEGKEENQ